METASSRESPSAAQDLTETPAMYSPLSPPPFSRALQPVPETLKFSVTDPSPSSLLAPATSHPSLDLASAPPESNPVTPLRSMLPAHLDPNSAKWSSANVFSPNSSRAADALVSLSSSHGHAASSSPSQTSSEFAPHAKLLWTQPLADGQQQQHQQIRMDARRHSVGSPAAFTFLRYVSSPILSAVDSDVDVDEDMEEENLGEGTESDDDSHTTSSFDSSMNKLDFSTDYDTEALAATDAEGEDTDDDKTEDEAHRVRRKAAAASSAKAKSVQNMVGGAGGARVPKPGMKKNTNKVARKRIANIKRKKAGIRKQTI